jgi:hypothetical protein
MRGLVLNTPSKQQQQQNKIKWALILDKISKKNMFKHSLMKQYLRNKIIKIEENNLLFKID